MTAAEATKIFRRHDPWALSRDKHPLEGKSVREWVQEARAGWPRVPVPKDPHKAAEKLAAAHDDLVFEEVA